MGATRLCLFLTVLVSVKMMAAQPIFGTKMWCDMICDDDDDDDYDDDSSASSSFEDLLDDFVSSIFNPCAGCTPTKKPANSKTTTLAPGMQQPFNIMIPPSNGVNLTMTNTGMSWLMNFNPWPAKPAAATTAAATTAAPATTAAGTTAAAGATTAETTTAKA